MSEQWKINGSLLLTLNHLPDPVNNSSSPQQLFQDVVRTGCGAGTSNCCETGLERERKRLRWTYYSIKLVAKNLIQQGKCK